MVRIWAVTAVPETDRAGGLGVLVADCVLLLPHAPTPLPVLWCLVSSSTDRSPPVRCLSVGSRLSRGRTNGPSRPFQSSTQTSGGRGRTTLDPGTPSTGDDGPRHVPDPYVCRRVWPATYPRPPTVTCPVSVCLEVRRHVLHPGPASPIPSCGVVPVCVRWTLVTFAQEV